VPSRPRHTRRERLIDELAEVGLELDDGVAADATLLDEVIYALRPPVHERRVPSFGAFIGHHIERRWEDATGLHVTRWGTWTRPTESVRRYADGLSTWLVRTPGEADEWIVLDRPASSERDLVVMARALAGTIVQRHPSGVVRVVGAHGVHRWNGIDWHHEPHIDDWMPRVMLDDDGNAKVLRSMLAFAVHDLGSQGIGSLLVYGWAGTDAMVEERLPVPPPLQITAPYDLAALRHALSQVDGAALFDTTGVLVGIGVRLVPSPAAEERVPGFGGMRHTSARRFTFDDQRALAIVVSEDGPVTLFRGGEVIARSGKREKETP
jgi:hypothetical protein